MKTTSVITCLTSTFAIKASIAIEDGRVLAGGLPPKQLKLVAAWT